MKSKPAEKHFALRSHTVAEIMNIDRDRSHVVQRRFDYVAQGLGTCLASRENTTGLSATDPHLPCNWLVASISCDEKDRARLFVQRAPTKIIRQWFSGLQRH